MPKISALLYDVMPHEDGYENSKIFEMLKIL